jgi:hypothetical protein
MLLILTIIAVGLYMYFLYKEIRTFQNEVNGIKSQIQTILMAPITAVASGVCCPINKNLAYGSSHKEGCAVSQTETGFCHDEVSISSNEIKDILSNIQNIDDDDYGTEDDGDDNDVQTQAIDGELHENEPRDILIKVKCEEGNSDAGVKDKNVDLRKGSKDGDDGDDGGDGGDGGDDGDDGDDDGDDGDDNNSDDDNVTQIVNLQDDIVLMEKKPVPDFANMSEIEIKRLKYDDLRNFLRSQGVSMQGKKSDLISKIKSITTN